MLRIGRGPPRTAGTSDRSRAHGSNKKSPGQVLSTRPGDVTPAVCCEELFQQPLPPAPSPRGRKPSAPPLRLGEGAGGRGGLTASYCTSVGAEITCVWMI